MMSLFALLAGVGCTVWLVVALYERAQLGDSGGPDPAAAHRIAVRLAAQHPLLLTDRESVAGYDPVFHTHPYLRHDGMPGHAHPGGANPHVHLTPTADEQQAARR